MWNANGALDEDSTVGSFLEALVGYDGDPSLLEVGVWLLFVTGALTLFVLPLLRRPRPEAART